jgi:autotransporter-associated beta strand protein
VVIGTPQTWNVADAASVLNISGIISGGAPNSTQAAPAANTSLTITGAGMVNFTNAANTFTGDIVLDGGGLIVDNDRDWGGATVASSTSKTITMLNGARLSVQGTALNPGANTTTNFNLLRVGTGAQTIDIPGSTFILTLDDGEQFGTADGAAITKSGLGVLVLGNNYDTLVAPNSSINVTGGILRLQTSANAFGGVNKGAITLSSGSALDLRLNSGGTFGNNVTVSGNSTITTGRTTAAASEITQVMGNLSIGEVTLTSVR